LRCEAGEESEIPFERREAEDEPGPEPEVVAERWVCFFDWGTGEVAAGVAGGEDGIVAGTEPEFTEPVLREKR
jgi:hypothetical protein